MAEGKHFHEFGYPDERFESVVSDNLHCGICSCVLKDPVMCKNEHYFCRGCITKHLENYHICPSCNQDLTVESLAVAPRIVRNLLSEQNIRCDYYERGCEEIVQLGNLASHVAVCGKTPVVCANEKCSREINKEDQFLHESEECRFREVKCRNCKEMNSTVQEIETSLGGLCEHVEKLNANVNEMKTGLRAVGNKFENVENKLEEMENKFENKFEKMENKFENRLGKMENRFQQVEKQLLNTKDPALKDGQNEAMHDERENARSNQATSLDRECDLKNAKNPNVNAYIVAGGYGTKGRLLNSAEIFDKTNNSWIQLSPMKKSRAEASTVIYNGQILVTGGTSDNNNIVSSIEQISFNPNPFVPPFWSYFPVNLPQALRGHRTVLYNNRMFVIGGYDEEKKMYSDTIYEIQLHFPFNTKILAKLPSSTPMDGCGVVLSDDNILIFGGRTYLDASAKVTMYDITKNEFKELAPLPYGLRNMATVKMGENVFLVGGMGKVFGGNEKNTILSYNIETQKITELPPMKQSRSECCAVADGNSLVVMGGLGQGNVPLSLPEASYFRTSRWPSKWSDRPKKDARRGGGLSQSKVPLSSVEAFNFKTSKWRDLPSMKEARKGFVAEIV